MAHVLWHFKVEDFDRWKAVYDEDPLDRGANGSQGGYVFRSANDPDEVMLLLEWDDAKLGQLRQLNESPKMEEVRERSGYTEQPTVYILEVADKPSA